jgi:small subunit ribosomal protein S8
MSFSDPIADMLNRIRNAHAAGIVETDVPHSKIKEQIAGVLQREGYLVECRTIAAADGHKALRLTLKYYGRGQSAIKGLLRLSKPGLRRYGSAGEIPRVKGGTGVVVVSTSAGIMTGTEAKARKLGGELLCSVW